MTISLSGRRFTYAGNGVTTAFSFPRLLLANTDIAVYLVNVATGVETLQTLVTHYTVAGMGDPAGVTVTFVTAPPTGNTVVLYGTTPQLQTYDPTDPGFVTALGTEDALDRLAVLIQEARDLIARVPILTEASLYAGSLELPAPVAGRAIGWNAMANGLANLVISGGGGGGSGSSVYVLRNIGGTGDAITAETGFALGSLTEHDIFWFKPGANNTGAAVINIDAIGSIDLRNPVGGALAADELHTAKYMGLVAIGSPVTSVRILAGF